MINKIYNFIYNSIDSNYPFSLSDKIGLSVLFANKYIREGKSQDLNILQKMIFDLINIPDTIESDLVNGASGILWLLKYLDKLEIIECIDTISVLDNIAKQKYQAALNINNWTFHYHGAMGYLLAIKDFRYDMDLLNFFSKNIHKDQTGKYKILSANFLQSTNLGLNGGILGILAFTNRLLMTGQTSNKIYDVQDKLLDIIFRKLGETKYQFFPALYHRTDLSKMCWTYGELTLAIQLLGVSICRSDSLLMRESQNVMLKALNRNLLSSSYVIDSSIFTGSAGNCLLYKIYEKYMNNSQYKQSEAIWRQYTSEILEYNNLYVIDRHTNTPKIDFSILEGLSGICLVLDNYENLWYEYLLLDMFT